MWATGINGNTLIIIININVLLTVIDIEAKKYMINGVI